MIINGVRTKAYQGALITLPLATLGAGLAVGVAMTPALGGAAVAAGALVASKGAYAAIRDNLFRSRVENLRMQAARLGLNPKRLPLRALVRQSGKPHGDQVTLTQLVDAMEQPGAFWLTREQVAEAHAGMLAHPAADILPTAPDPSDFLSKLSDMLPSISGNNTSEKSQNSRHSNRN